MLAGRTFDARDDASAPSRAVVSANFARAGLSGHAVRCRHRAANRAARPRSLEIIGVVGDVALDVYGAPTLVVYHAHRQFAGNRNWALHTSSRPSLPPERILAAVRAAVAALDPELVVYRAAPMTDVVGRGVQPRAIRARADGRVRGRVADARRPRSLRRARLRRAPAHAGDRDPDGPRRDRLQVRALVLRQAGLVLGLALVAGTAGALVLGRWLSSLVFRSARRTLAFFWHRAAADADWAGCGVAARAPRIASAAAHGRGAVGLRVTALSPDGVDRCRPISPRLGSARAPSAVTAAPQRGSPVSRESRASGRAPPWPTAWSPGRHDDPVVHLAGEQALEDPQQMVRRHPEHRRAQAAELVERDHGLVRARPRAPADSPGGSRCRSPRSSLARSRAPCAGCARSTRCRRRPVPPPTCIPDGR